MFTWKASVAATVALITTSSARYTNFSSVQATNFAAASSSYTLRDAYDSGNFFNTWNFFTGSDPTHGYVEYLSQNDAQNRGIVNRDNGQIYLGVDYTTVNPSAGRASVRLSSNKDYTHGLFIADIAHMPGSICGVWPAFWMFGPNWPASGEIDIIEGVNSNQAGNQMTLHTAGGCNVNNDGSRSPLQSISPNCNDGNAYNGCGALSHNSNTYGDGFNANGGGVYAMQWESSGIYIWFFPRNAIPSDITSGTPATSNWGLPLAAFNGCDTDSYFRNHNIIFDTTFCGDWAGAVWGSSGCGGNSCQAFVGANPGLYREAYWLINSVKVYQF